MELAHGSIFSPCCCFVIFNYPFISTSGPNDLRDIGGGEIIVLSDGFESHAPSVSDTMELIKIYGVTINTISLGNADTNILDILAMKTYGTPEYSLIQPEESLVSLTD